MAIDGQTIPGVWIDEATDIEDIVSPFEDPDDGKEHLTHVINPTKNLHIWRPGLTSKEIVVLARVAGIELMALCGYKWVPTRNPEHYPACSECMEIAAAMIRGDA